ncbi:sugar phosphate isomerase/epimerase [uncultured Tessaracoccus sp.]|uniref:sugar phosphate isomerase/epimerase family protein n=1 Tax=uncultured Tessaracoccus sp. TaxID=905023 RepID=UPI0026110E8F|nr:sugar phosphate isomerase/epimerase [uncultured Tessaracoccus sp.]
MKIAGAPISWGVCEVPGWGYQMSPERVLTEMKEIGLTATEFGPAGWLPTDPAARAEAIKPYGLRPVGSFFLAVMHDPDIDPLPAVERELDAFEAAGGEFLVLAADSGRDGYDDRPVLDEQGWATLFANMSKIADACAARGVTAVLHPHWGTMVQNVDEVERVLDNSSVGLCLDTGHLAAGGADVVELVRKYAKRVGIVHAKDVRKDLVDKLLPGELTWSEAIKGGVFTPIGEGDIDFAQIVKLLDEAGFDGYYVLEQDKMLDDEPPADGGPIVEAKKSLEALQALA